MVLEAWKSKTCITGLKSRCHQGHGGSRGRVYSSPSPASGGYQHFSACGCITSIFKASILTSLSAPSSQQLLLCLCQISLCFSLIKVLVIEFRTQPVIQDNLPISRSFPNRIAFTGFRG